MSNGTERRPGAAGPTVGPRVEPRVEPRVPRLATEDLIGYKSS